MAGPAVGQIVDGYRFNGGDPNNQASWEPVGGGGSSEDWGPGTRVLPNGAVIAEGPRGGIRVLREATMVSGADPSNPLFQPMGAAGGLKPDERKELATFRGAASDAGSVIRDTSRFMELNRQASTGAPLSVPVLGDILVGLDPRKQEMRAITERLTPQQREAGSGAMSDRDVEMYRRSVVNIGQTGRANANVATVLQAGAARQREYSAFMEEYARANGTLVGAQERWGEYTAEHPLFQEDANGNVVPKRGVPSWRQYFGVPARRQGPAQPQRNPQTPAARPAAPAQPQARQGAQRRFQRSDFTDAQIAALERIPGGRPGGQVGSRTNPRMIKSEREYRSLPNGAWYIDDGGFYGQKGRE